MCGWLWPGATNASTGWSKPLPRWSEPSTSNREKPCCITTWPVTGACHTILVRRSDIFPTPWTSTETSANLFPASQTSIRCVAIPSFKALLGCWAKGRRLAVSDWLPECDAHSSSGNVCASLVVSECKVQFAESERVNIASRQNVYVTSAARG